MRQWDASVLTPRNSTSCSTASTVHLDSKCSVDSSAELDAAAEAGIRAAFEQSALQSLRWRLSGLFSRSCLEGLPWGGRLGRVVQVRCLETASSLAS
eukprot:1967760-Rhodomonas_salina.1